RYRVCSLLHIGLLYGVCPTVHHPSTTSLATVVCRIFGLIFCLLIPSAWSM
ncbi:hypothetical protein BC567DRAFT_213740, partial [Phyllosticta citribraziliensis]